MYGDINFAPYYMHSALRDKMPNVSSLICIQPLKKNGWDSKRLEQIWGGRKNY